MDYQKSIEGLLKEAKLGRSYLQMGKGYRNILKIAMFPLYIVEVALLFCYYVQLFFYNALLSPAAYLEEWQETKKDGVKHATQAVIYFVSTPFIFFLRIAISMLSFSFFFLWFTLMCITYLVTVGGIKWQPCINLAEFETERTTKVKCAAVEKFAVTLFFGFVLTAAMIFLNAVCGIWQLTTSLSVIAGTYGGIMFLVNALVSAFAREAITVKAEEEEEEEEDTYAKRMTPSKSSLDNVVFASLMWAIVGIVMFILAIVRNDIELFSDFDEDANGLAIMSILFMAFATVMAISKLSSSSKGSSKAIILNAKTVLAGILVALCLVGSLLGTVQYIAYVVDDGNVNNSQTISSSSSSSQGSYLTETMAINYAKNSQDVKNKIYEYFGISYYTPSYTSSTAVKEVTGWTITLKGTLSYYNFTALVSMSESGEVISTTVLPY